MPSRAARVDTAGNRSGRPLRLPRPVLRRIEAMATRLMQPADGWRVDFAAPEGEPALAPADGVAWQVFRNPVALFVGGIAAVILELAEPRVRSGVWDHSGFRSDPVTRLQRTGLAAMITVFAARGTAEAMIARVRGLHDRIGGETPDGRPYRASDPALLDWVQATASYGFLEAYCAYVRPLSTEDRDRFLAEGRDAAELYGALGAPLSDAALQACIAGMEPALEPSPIVFEFLDIMRHAPILARALRPAQGLFLRAAAALVPHGIRSLLGLGRRYDLAGWERRVVCRLGRIADRVMLPSSPAVRSCRRLGLPDDYLWGR